MTKRPAKTTALNVMTNTHTGFFTPDLFFILYLCFSRTAPPIWKKAKCAASLPSLLFSYYQYSTKTAFLIPESGFHILIISSLKISSC